MKKKTHKKRRVLDRLLDLFTIGILIVSLLGYFGKYNWFLDLFSHFRVQYLQLCLIPFIIALWRRRNKLAIALVLLVCLNYTFVLPLYFGKPSPGKEKPIRAMLMNLNAGNGNTEQVLEAIKLAAPDILLLEEVTPKWAQELKVLDTTFRYRITEPQDGCFGISLLSKYPLEHSEIVEIGTTGVPSIITEAHFPNGVISIIGTHPLPPVGTDYSNQRNTQLAALPGYVEKQKYPVLLIGDLNTTPWSFHFQHLLKESGLKNSMQGFGHQPSWPSEKLFLRIPLDHMLHAEAITIHNRMIGPKVGSDHLPVIVDFSVK
ncbi:endonuclease/exonuclease/phosphatase family protein [Pontiellaceae bacterium B12227]|nr:endonuclease/exonuclease/phosphatase family protein [Pontiellaceae bacterium B12227]